MAIGSCCSESNADGLGSPLTMLKLFGQNPQRKCFGFSHGFVGRVTVGKNARKLRHFRKPSTIFFLFIFDTEIHRLGSTYCLGILRRLYSFTRPAANADPAIACQKRRRSL